MPYDHTKNEIKTVFMLYSKISSPMTSRKRETMGEIPSLLNM